LVDVSDAVEPHQIRRSNSYALAAALRLRGYSQVSLWHAPDDPDRLRAVLSEAFTAGHVTVVTGGVSMGGFDYVPAVMQSLGVTPLFHKVRQRPGKPFWFGVGKDGRPVFALPGNPVSAVICLYRYLLPHLEWAMGAAGHPTERAALGAPVTFKPELTYFLPVRLDSDEGGRLVAEPRPTNTSGDFATLSGTDGFVALDAERTDFERGYVAPLCRWGA
jgi:molybdopterin molybdotransferase